jgi:hypothetical protein
VLIYGRTKGDAVGGAPGQQIFDPLPGGHGNRIRSRVHG